MDVIINHDSVDEEEQEAVDNLRKVQGQINELINILNTNVQTLQERGGNLEALEGLSDQLLDKASEFKVITRSMRYKHLARNNKWCLLSVVLAFLLVGVIIGVVVLGIKLSSS
ncbi:uncharacterized protein LOC133189596 [Saccostrea echinata]|uniref:uncharacterized protein LOC133189596 n=1 Tax=Saccostrea echinata TaxID=191078 RepID=UPI002A80D400|nr:uncharacterized protein LOC133189596 [Saccostrea echinata]